MNKIALITGAYGGMGRAAARLFGQSHSLFLTDIDEARLNAFCDTLEEEGATIRGRVAGDLADPDMADKIVGQARAAGRLAAVIHTAGLSPALAGAAPILRTNVTATERLLRALETELDEGLVAVLIASIAGHMPVPFEDVEALCARSLDEDFPVSATTRIEAQMPSGNGLEQAGTAYIHSKRAVIRMAEARAEKWGKAGARIVSISPGMIYTPMGRSELESNPQSAALVGLTPLGWGRASDIAETAYYLASDKARFITGCDIRVDGGLTPITRGAQHFGG